jgi:parallel beta-helix repeat (two copies)
MLKSKHFIETCLAIAVLLLVGFTAAADDQGPPFTTEFGSISFGDAPADQDTPMSPANGNTTLLGNATEPVDVAEPEDITEPVNETEAMNETGDADATPDLTGEEPATDTTPEETSSAQEIITEPVIVPEPMTRTVFPNDCDYESIQAAIDAAYPGDTIVVHSGIYNERLNVTKPLVIRGMNTGAGMPVVDAEGNGSTIILNADGIVLEGLYLTGAGSWPESGIKVNSDDNIIVRVNVWENKWVGIYLRSCSNNTIAESISSNNDNDGVMFFYSTRNTFRNNVVGNNGDDGVQFLNSGDNEVTGNVISNNDDDGIVLDTSENNYISANNINNNNRGIFLKNTEIEGIGANTFGNNSAKILLVS